MKVDQEKKEYIESLTNLSDRELLELRAYYDRKTMEYAKSSNAYLFVIYLLSIVSAVASIIIAIL